MKKLFYIIICVFLLLIFISFKSVSAATCDGICDLKCTVSGCALTSWKRISDTRCSRKMCMKDCSGKAGCCGSWTQYKSCPLSTSTPAPTKTPTPTLTGTTTPTTTVAPTSSTCTKKSKGDANCDNSISLTDFEIWRSEFVGTVSTTRADFNSDGKASLVDFETWRSNIGG